MKSPYTFEDGLVIGYYLNRRGKPIHPDKVTFVENDEEYEAPPYRPGEPAVQGETFSTYTEVWYKKIDREGHLDPTQIVRTRVWGVAIINRGTRNETVTRLIYPNKTYARLIDF